MNTENSEKTVLLLMISPKVPGKMFIVSKYYV